MHALIQGPEPLFFSRRMPSGQAAKISDPYLRRTGMHHAMHVAGAKMRQKMCDRQSVAMKKCCSSTHGITFA
jgi:hypothetical protein